MAVETGSSECGCGLWWVTCWLSTQPRCDCPPLLTCASPECKRVHAIHIYICPCPLSHSAMHTRDLRVWLPATSVATASECSTAIVPGPLLCGLEPSVCHSVMGEGCLLMGLS